MEKIDRYVQVSPAVKSKYGRRPYSKKVRQDPATRKKVQLLYKGYGNMTELIRMKYMKSLYDDMDKDRISKPDYQNKEGKDMRSYVAQTHLRKLVHKLCSTEVFDAAYGGANEFERQRGYQNFVKEHLQQLRTWSKTFFTENSIEGYLVTVTHLGSYDFDKQGHWINIQPTMGPKFGTQHFATLEAKSPVEHNILNLTKTKHPGSVKSLSAFLKIPPAKAEQLLEQNTKRVYVVRKIKTIYQDIVDTQGRDPVLKFNFHHLNNIMEIYEDAGLIKKLDEISLNQLSIPPN